MVYVKAILDEKNFSPSQVIDDLTCYENWGNGCTSVGFIDGKPVIFDYEPNDCYMVVTCKDMNDTDKLRPVILKYLSDNDMCSDGKIVARLFTGMCMFRIEFLMRKDDNE